ncbi:MAG TPA: LysR family transcriptional regulator [Herminiimonas sp.]|nr:LysR family transcriptional regulator [Herminiimonas sp.]
MSINKIDLLKTFVRVAEVGSFTQAAANLGLQKASVSEHVRTLEDIVGARLLHRTTRKVQATHDGLALLERCKDLLSDMDEIEGMFRRHGAELSGRLRVDMPTAIARKIVMPRLAEFIMQYPQVQIEVSSTDRRVDVVREGFDCVLRAGETVDDSLIARQLGMMTMANCASPAYLARCGTPQTLEDLASHQLIHYSPVLGMRSSGFEYAIDGETRSIAMAGAVTVNNVESYEAACLGGLGIVQAPLKGMRDYIDSGKLVNVLPQFVPTPMPISLLYAHRRHLPQRVRIFMDWLSALLEENDVV